MDQCVFKKQKIGPKVGLVGDESSTNNMDQCDLKKQKIGPKLGPVGVHVSQLPPEILSIVFSFLDYVDLCRATRVCSQWCHTAYDLPMWRHTVIRFSKLPKHSTRVFRSLSWRGIRHLHTLDMEVLKTASQHLPNLIGLCHSFHPVTEQKVCGYPLKHRANPQKLNWFIVSGCTSLTINLITHCFKNLVWLSLRSCYDLSDLSLLHITDGLPALKWLDLEGSDLSDAGIGYLSGHGFPYLKGWPALEFLSLKNGFSEKITDLALQYLSEGQASLIELDLSTEPRLAPLIHWTDEGMIHLAKMEKLSKLKLSTTNISAAGLAHLAEGGSRIKILNLRSCLDLTDDAMIHVGEMKDLRELRLTDTYVGDEGLGHLAAAGSQLAILHGSDLVTEVGLQHLAKLTNFSRLKLDNTKITCEGLVDFMDIVAERLTHLNLYYCDSLDCRTLLYVAQRLFRLEWLKLDSYHVNDEGMAAAARNLTRLRQLTVNTSDIIDELRNIGRVMNPINKTLALNIAVAKLRM